MRKIKSLNFYIICDKGKEWFPFIGLFGECYPVFDKCNEWICLFYLMEKQVNALNFIIIKLFSDFIWSHWRTGVNKIY